MNPKLSNRATITFAAAAFAAATVAIWSFDSQFEHALQRSPQMRIWLGLMVLQGAIAGGGLFPSLDVLRGLRHVGSRRRWIIGLGLIGVLALLALLFMVFPVVLSAFGGVEPFEHHDGRMIATLCMWSVTTLVACAAMWIAATNNHDHGHDHDDTTAAAAALLQQRSTVRRLLAFLGLQIGMLTLTTGVLRSAVLRGGWWDDGAFPAEMVFAYGGCLAFVLALVYLPAYMDLRRRAEHIRRIALDAEHRELDDWLRLREELGELLGLKTTWSEAMVGTIPLLAPLLGAILAKFLGVDLEVYW